MYKSLAIGAGLLFVAVLGSLIMGFASNAPFLLILGLLCLFPLFMLVLGATLGRATTELTISRRERAVIQPVPVNRTQRTERRMPDTLG